MVSDLASDFLSKQQYKWPITNIFEHLREVLDALVKCWDTMQKTCVRIPEKEKKTLLDVSLTIADDKRQNIPA